MSPHDTKLAKVFDTRLKNTIMQIRMTQSEHRHKNNDGDTCFQDENLAKQFEKVYLR